MARGKAINVKIATSKIIKALQTRLDENTKAVKANEKAEADHKVALEKYHKQIVKDFAKDLTIDSISTRWNGQLEINYKVAKGVEFPKQPELNKVRELGSWEVDEINNAIRILQLTDDEVVSTSTYNAVAQYI